MLQCNLIFLNGSLGFERPRLVCRPPALTCGKEWLKSDLDDIGHDLFPSPVGRPASRQRAPRYPRSYWSYWSQYRLVNLDGVVTVQLPRPWRRDSPETATGLTSKKINGTAILKLPVEIRLCIYKYLLIFDRCPTLCSDLSALRIMRPDIGDLPYGLHPQILATCRQINREGTPMLYSENVFHRQFLWRISYSMSAIRPWPRFDSSPLTAANLSSVSHIRLFRGYNRWFTSSGYLKPLREFPSLRELRIYIDLNDRSDGVSLMRLWKDSIAAVSEHRPDLVCFKAQLRLAFDQEYTAWCERHRGKNIKGEGMDFSIHRAKKAKLEEWMRAQRLFEGRELAWSFTTETSQYVGPCCLIGFTVDNSHRAEQIDMIRCLTRGDYQSEMSLEPV
ncbi:hypothetical protein ACJZ2D_011502 [Fusarium nematophilum]